MATPTARTLAELRKQGYVAAVVERWLPKVDLRKDLFGCIDVLACHGLTAGCLGVQATTRENVMHRVEKAAKQIELRTFLQAGNRFEVWGWEQRGGKWTHLVYPVTLRELAGIIVMPKRRKKDRQKALFGEK